MDAWLVARPCTPAHARARLVYPDVAATQLLYWELNYVCQVSTWTILAVRVDGKVQLGHLSDDLDIPRPWISRALTHSYYVSHVFPHSRPPSGPLQYKVCDVPEGELRLSVVYASLQTMPFPK